VTIFGQGFDGGASVDLAGAAVAPNANADGSLTVRVPDANVATTGAVGVTVVVNGVRSNTAYFTVSSPAAASVSAVSPTSTRAQGSPSPLAIRVDGSGFTQTSQVVVAGRVCVTTFTSATSLSAKIPSDLLTGAATHSVAVRDSVTGATSGTVNFQVQPGIQIPTTCEDVTSRTTCLLSGCGWFEPIGPCVSDDGGFFCEDIATRSTCLNEGCGWIVPNGPCID